MARRERESIMESAGHAPSGIIELKLCIKGQKCKVHLIVSKKYKLQHCRAKTLTAKPCWGWMQEGSPPPPSAKGLGYNLRKIFRICICMLVNIS